VKVPPPARAVFLIALEALVCDVSVCIISAALGVIPWYLGDNRQVLA
jgi:hypothetical protein